MPVADVNQASRELVVGLQYHVVETFRGGSDLLAERIRQVLDCPRLAVLYVWDRRKGACLLGTVLVELLICSWVKMWSGASCRVSVRSPFGCGWANVCSAARRINKVGKI